MKRFILSLVFVFVTTFSFGQAPRMNFMQRIDFSKYEVVDSLPLERIMIHFDKEIDDDRLISLGNGDYMAPLPHNDKIVIRTDVDRTKAIVLYKPAAETIKTAILQGQYEAAKGVNRIQLAVYFGIGKYVSLNTRKGVWSTGALEAIS